MMNRNRILTGLAFLLISIVLLNCHEKPGWDITVKGKVQYPQDGQVYIQEIRASGEEAPREAIVLNDDSTYSKTIRLIEPGYYRLSFFDKQFVSLILDKSDVEVNADGSNFNGAVEIKGSPDHDLIARIQTILGNLESSPDARRLQDEFGLASVKQDAKRIAEIQEEYLALIGKGHDMIANIVNDQPASLAVISLLQQGVLDRDKYYDLYQATAEKVKKDFPSILPAKEFITMVDGMKATAIGQEAPEIELPNPDGQLVKLSSLRGKYVLVDFWAKWCGPCRRENPNVVSAYHKYKDKGFDVFGVSLDRTREDWLQAIEEDGLTWTHVSDLKYFDSQAARIYNVAAIPFSVLVDPQGKIVAKNLRGGALDKKLEEVLGNK